MNQSKAMLKLTDARKDDATVQDRRKLVEELKIKSIIDLRTKYGIFNGTNIPEY